MDLQKSRLLRMLFGTLGLILLPLGAALGSAVLIYGAFISYIAAVFIWFAYNRCPHCRKRLGRSTSLYCPYCKKKL